MGGGVVVVVIVVVMVRHWVLMGLVLRVLSDMYLLAERCAESMPWWQAR